MKCSACGHPYEEGDRFCGHCGSKHSAEPDQTPSFVPLPDRNQPRRKVKRTSNPKQKRFRFRPLKILGILSLVAIVGIAISSWLVYSQFDTINRLSEVPDSVEVAMDDVGTPVSIDTGPALRALEESANPVEDSSDDQTSFTNSVHASTLATPMATVEATSSKDHEGTTILLMGVDAGSSEEIDVGVRPDSLSVLHLDPNTGTCRILGIPRDSRVELPGYGLTKINHALAVGGVPYQTLVVEQYLNIEIDHYGLVDFDGLVGVVDSVGGITVDNPYAFDQGGIHFAEGEIELDGETALVFARYRHGPDGDFGRIDRQQLVLRALLRELGGVDAVRAVPSLLSAAEGHFKTDLSAIQMTRMANQYRQTCTSSTLETRSLTGAVENHPDPLFNAELSFVVLDPEDVMDGVEWLSGSREESNAVVPGLRASEQFILATVAGQPRH